MAKWLPSTEHIQYDVQDRVATITLNRPEKRNAISQVMLREFQQALLESDDCCDVSVIVDNYTAANPHTPVSRERQGVESRLAEGEGRQLIQADFREKTWMRQEAKPKGPRMKM